MNEIIIFANVIIKIRYDDKNILLNLKKNNEVYLRFHYKYKILEKENRKFHQQRVDFFLILSKVDNFIYKFDLSFIIKI